MGENIDQQEICLFLVNKKCKALLTTDKNQALRFGKRH